MSVMQNTPGNTSKASLLLRHPVFMVNNRHVSTTLFDLVEDCVFGDIFRLMYNDTLSVWEVTYRHNHIPQVNVGLSL